MIDNKGGTISGNISVVAGKSNKAKVNQEVHNTAKIHNWAEKLPTGETVTSKQLQELREVLEAFTKSEAYSEMSNKDTEPLKKVLDETKKPFQGKKKRWEALKGFLVNAVGKLIPLMTQLTAFIEKHPGAAKWIKDLIDRAGGK